MYIKGITIHCISTHIASNCQLKYDMCFFLHREQRTHAMLGLLSAKGLMTVDELRRGIEGLPTEVTSHAYKRVKDS